MYGVSLHQRDPSNECAPFIILNWTRCGKKCYAAVHTRAAVPTQPSKLYQYFGCNKEPSSITTMTQSPMGNPESHPDAQSQGLFYVYSVA